ncbi:MAG: hypothetical protein GXP25_16890 [Planctomycetes bacterium]|nr:hypothetical protein [Planctomycetota bacterium]
MMKWRTVAALITLALACPTAQGKDNKVHDSRWPLLLVDSTGIAKNEGVSLTVCEATRYPDNPVVRLGRPGSPDAIRCHFDGSVYYIDGTFRMWYKAVSSARHANAYAESKDGIHWTKPRLGLVDFGGNKQNNLIPMAGGAIVFHDPDDKDPSRRFKKAVVKPSPQGIGSLWSLAFSPDGLRWKTVQRPDPILWHKAESDVLTRIGGEWFIYAQGTTKQTGRIAVAFHSNNINTPPSEWKKEVVWTMRDKYGVYQAHHGIKPWVRGGLIIGVYGILHDRHELRDATIDLGMLLSHDGIHWREPWPLATILRRGQEGAWDSMFILQGAPCFVNVRDKTYLYYGGTDTGNMGDFVQIGLATLRRDGFGYVGIDIGWTFSQPGPRTGGFTTVPIRLHDRTKERVLLNVDNLSKEKEQFVKVELLDDKGSPIPGYTLADADPLTDNGIAVPATWHGDSSLAKVQSDVIRLRVHLQGGQYRRESPKVYAIYFSEPPEIEQ